MSFAALALTQHADMPHENSEITLVRSVRRRNVTGKNKEKFRRLLRSLENTTYGPLVSTFLALEKDVLTCVDRLDQTTLTGPAPDSLETVRRYFCAKRAYKCLARKFPYRVVTIDGLDPEEETLLRNSLRENNFELYYKPWMHMKK